MTIKAMAEARLIQISGKCSPSAPPTMTPMADTQARAIDAPMRTAQGRRVCAARVTAASWVLSPNSAIKITPNVVNITRQSIYLLLLERGLKAFACDAPATQPARHMTANRIRSGTVSTRQSTHFLQSKLLGPLYQSAIDFLSKTLLWFSAGGVAGMKISPNYQQQFSTDQSPITKSLAACLTV